MKNGNIDTKKEIERIMQSAKNKDGWKHEEEKVVLTKEFVEGIDRLFATLEAAFPAWRVSMKNDEQIGNVKRLWANELMRAYKTTGKRPNIKQGVRLAIESDSDFFPSIGKFISWCEQDDSNTGPQAMLRRFNRGDDPITYIEQVTRSRCGYKAKRMTEEKGEALFLSTLKQVKQSSTNDRVLSIENKSFSNPNKSIFTKRENQSEINLNGLAGLPKID